MRARTWRVHPLLPPGTLTVARFVLSITVLLAPTMLMGATFPLVVRASLRGARPLGEDASVLYAANTAGGIAGTLLAGFWLIGGIGIGASFRVAAAINVAVGLIAIALSMLREQGAQPDRAPVADVADEPATPVRRRLLAVFAVSGFASLALEVVWFRVLVLFLQVTTYAFTVMLAAFLSGIAAGSPWTRVCSASARRLAPVAGRDRGAAGARDRALAAVARPLVRRAADAGALAGPPGRAAQRAHAAGQLPRAVPRDRPDGPRVPDRVRL